MPQDSADDNKVPHESTDTSQAALPDINENLKDLIVNKFDMFETALEEIKSLKTVMEEKFRIFETALEDIECRLKAKPSEQPGAEEGKDRIEKGRSILQKMDKDDLKCVVSS